MKATGFCPSLVCQLRTRLFLRGDERLDPPCPQCLGALREAVEVEARNRSLPRTIGERRGRR